MSSNEEMAIRYSGGYIAMKPMKCFPMQNSIKARDSVECLSHMAVDEEESSFVEYTQMWIKPANRGGLFEVNDATFLF